MARLASWFSILVCVVFANTALAVLVSGQAYLTGQSDHANIQVMFEAVSPSAVTDSIYTNSQGDFTQSIEPGVYNVLYSYEDFATYRLPNEVLLWDTTLDPVTLMPPLSGYLSGILGPGDFQVTDSIVVATGQSLIIQPGTRLYFDGLHKFIVRGLLTASGTEQDSFCFHIAIRRDRTRCGRVSFCGMPMMQRSLTMLISSMQIDRRKAIRCMTTVRRCIATQQMRKYLHPPFGKTAMPQALCIRKHALSTLSNVRLKTTAPRQS